MILKRGSIAVEDWTGGGTDGTSSQTDGEVTHLSWAEETRQIRSKAEGTGCCGSAIEGEKEWGTAGCVSHRSGRS